MLLLNKIYLLHSSLMQEIEEEEEAESADTEAQSLYVRNRLSSEQKNPRKHGKSNIASKAYETTKLKLTKSNTLSKPQFDLLDEFLSIGSPHDVPALFTKTSKRLSKTVATCCASASQPARELTLLAT